MSILLKAAAVALFLPFVAGCFVAHDERPSLYASTQDAEVAVVMAPEVEEVHYVVYREYFGCTEQEIAWFPHYRRYYGLNDDDLYFIYFTSRQVSISFDVCFRSYYYDCGGNYDRLVLFYHVPRERYFVAIGAGVSLPPMYTRTYASYRSGSTANVTFTNQEYVALVHMKVACEYQGHPPATYFERVQSTGSTRRVIVESREQSGRGGRTAAGAPVTATVPHPWTMPPQQKLQWHKERQASAATSEVRFKEVHKEQVTKVEKQGPTPPKAAPRAAEQKPSPGKPPPPPRADGKDPSDPKQRHHAEEPREPAERPSGHPPSEPQPPKKAEKPPPKHPPQEPGEKPKEGEKRRGERQEDKKDNKDPKDKGERRDP